MRFASWVIASATGTRDGKRLDLLKFVLHKNQTSYLILEDFLWKIKKGA